MRSSAYQVWVLFWLIPILPLLDYITTWIILWRDGPCPAHRWRTIWYHTSNAFKILTSLTFHFSSLNFFLHMILISIVGKNLWKFMYGNRFNVCYLKFDASTWCNNVYSGMWIFFIECSQTKEIHLTHI